MAPFSARYTEGQRGKATKSLGQSRARKMYLGGPRRPPPPAAHNTQKNDDLLVQYDGCRKCSQTAFYPPPETPSDCALCLTPLSSFVPTQPSPSSSPFPTPAQPLSHFTPGSFSASRWKAGRPEAKGKDRGPATRSPAVLFLHFRLGWHSGPSEAWKGAQKEAPTWQQQTPGSGLVGAPQWLPPPALPSWGPSLPLPGAYSEV